MPEHVTRELTLGAPLPVVWAAVLAGDWLAERTELEPRAGGTVRCRDEGEEREGWIETFTPPGPRSPRRAALAFWWAAAGETATRVELVLVAGETTDGRPVTLVRVTETRPLDARDLVAIPLPEVAGPSYGPVLRAA
jgi:hypothetical protein